jgi:hypothetical protein
MTTIAPTTQTLLGAPETWVKQPVESLFSLGKDELDALQMHWVRQRFEDLREHIPAVSALAERQDVSEITDFDALAMMLFTHQTYKNYPLSLIEKKQFDQLTHWLDKLTAHKLTRVDMGEVGSIDEWLQCLDEAGMFIFHSTGTSGQLSFFPRSQTEKEAWIESNYTFLESFMPGIRDVHLPVFWPSFRSGRQAGMRLISHFGPALAGGEDEYHSLFDMPLSADFMSIAMRMARAKKAGNLKAFDTLKAIFQTRGEIVTLQARKAGMTREFFQKMVREYRGKRVFLMAQATDLLDIANEGLASGVSNVFAPDSVLLTGGGFKGREDVASANWKDLLQAFYGVDQVFMCYGMTELNTYHPACSKGVYHLFPWNIPLALSLDGKLQPRTGAQTGRAGYFDLLAQTYWGGILTGDHITIHYDEECGCGWKGPWIEDNVQRVTELMRGDDIISCAGVKDAAVSLDEFLLENVPE